MEKNVKVINFEDEVFDTDVAYEDVAAIAVNIWSGDEVLTIFTKDGKVYQHDAADYHYYRNNACADGFYVVYPADFEKWDQRTSTGTWAEGGYYSDDE